MLLNETIDTEIAISSNVPCVEVWAEIFDFKTTTANQIIRLDVTVPFTVHTLGVDPMNGAFRMYLDGSGYTKAGLQWDGYLIANGGQWVNAKGVPCNGRLSYSGVLTVKDPGEHKLRVMFSGSTTTLIGTLRSRRVYQIS